METESKFWIGWDEEREGLRTELCRLQEELAESHAAREELQSRTHALTHRLSQTVDMSLSLRLDSEQREWRRKMREGKEREARQALLIHKLQNKVVEYKGLCGRLEQQVMTAERTRMLRDEHSDELESTLIRLEEEQHRCVALGDVNALLRSQLNQSTEANQALQDDLKKLTADWSKAVEEVGQREIDWHQEKQTLAGHVAAERTRLMLIWTGVEALRRQCHSVKTTTDKDLWELRAEFSRLSSTLLSLPYVTPIPSTISSGPLSSTLGPLMVEDLGHEQTELTVIRKENSGLRSRIGELTGTVMAQECERQKQDKEMERLREEKQQMEQLHADAERSLESVQHAVKNLYRVIVSQRLDGHSRTVPNHVEPSDGLSSVLAIIAQAETALQWKHQELQEAEGSMRRLKAETESLDQRIKQLGDEREEFQCQASQRVLELKQTQTLLNSEKEIVEGLRKQLVEMEKCGEELKKENKQLRLQREKMDEERSEREIENQRRVEAELLENAQLYERESRIRLELHNVQEALERERLDRARIEKEATETKDALIKVRESLMAMTSSHTLLTREAADRRDALEKMAALNESLTHDKRELSTRTLQLEVELAEAHTQMQKFQSDMAALQRELKAVSMETTQLRAHRDTELDSLQQVQHGERELQKQLQILREEKETESTTLAEERVKREELCEQHRAVCEELDKVKADLYRIAEHEKTQQREIHTHLKENQQLEKAKHTLETQTDKLKQDKEELRDLTVTLQQQLGVAQDQVSELELYSTQLNMQVNTLTQAKEVLHGEIQCLQAELERETVLRQQDKQVASEERMTYEKETEHGQAQIGRLRSEAVRASEQLRTREAEQREARQTWQREREALNSELGQKDGEVEVLTNRLEALLKQNRELSDMVEEKKTDLEQLQVELAGDCKALEARLKHTNEELETWRMRTGDIQREKEELNQTFLERAEKQSAELEFTKREKDNLASLLRKREMEIQQKDKNTEEFILNMRLQEGVIETLKAQLKEKELLERKLVALEEQSIQLKERESARRKEEERREREREAEEGEREMRLRGELTQKEVKIEELQDRVEDLLREKKHFSWMLEEKEDNLEKLQNKLTREQKNLELMAKEANDEMERWKRRAGDMEKGKEEVNQMLVDRVERERNNITALEKERGDLRNNITALEKERGDLRNNITALEKERDDLRNNITALEKERDDKRNNITALEKERDDLRNVLREREKEIQKGNDDLIELKSTIKSLEGVMENERKQKQILEDQLMMLEEQNSQLMKRDQERLYEWAKMEAVHKEQENVLHIELEQRGGEVETLSAQAKEILKEKDDILNQLDERDTELEKMKARLKQEQLSFEQRVKDDDKQKEKWKLQVRELEKEIKRLEEREESRMRLEGEREQALRGDISQIGEEVKQLRGKIAQLDGENKEMHRKTLEQNEQLQCKTSLLREREQDTKRMREILEQKVKEENEKVQQGQEDLRRLTSRLAEMEQNLKDTRSDLKREGHLLKEKENELLDCNQKLHLANARGDEQKEKIQDLEERSKRLIEEVETLRGKLEEQSGELERKSQLLQDSEREFRKLETRVEDGEEESKRLRTTLSQREGEVEQLEVRLKVRKAEEEQLRLTLEELQRGHRSLLEERRCVETLETQLRELKEEREQFSLKLRRMKGELDVCKEEAVRERQDKDTVSFSLKQKEEELKEVQEREEATASQLAALREDMAALSVSKEHARAMVKEHNQENKKMREGLKAGLQEMATLNNLLEASHREGERLRCILQGKKDELVRNKEEHASAAGLRADLQVQVQRLDKKNHDLQAELELRECELRKNLEEATTVVKQKEAELARARSRTVVVEEQIANLSHVVSEKSKWVEKLSVRVKELEEALKKKSEDLKKSEQMIELLKKEVNDIQDKLEEREKGSELLNKELRDREREIEVMKKMIHAKERTNGRLKYTEEQSVKEMVFAKEKLNEKETELEKVRELAFKEEKARELLQDQLDEARAETKTLKGLVESLNKEKQDKIAKLERDIYHLRESEKNNNKLKKKIYKQLQCNLTDMSEISKQSDSQTETRDELMEEHELDTLDTQTEALENPEPLAGRDAEVHGPQGDGVWEVLHERVRAVMLEKLQTGRRLREKELEVYALKDRAEDLSKDRERVRTALEKTESMLIHYKERLQSRAEPVVGDMKGRCGEEAEPSLSAEERLCAMQRAVAQLELRQRQVEQRNRHLEQHVQRLKTERQHLRDTLKQVELERARLSRQLNSGAGSGIQEPGDPAGADELHSLRAHAGELMEQVHRLRLKLAVSQEERAEFIDRSLTNSHRLLSLRQDLTSSLRQVTQRLHPAVLQSETERLDRSIRQEELSLSLSQS